MKMFRVKHMVSFTHVVCLCMWLTVPMTRAWDWAPSDSEIGVLRPVPIAEEFAGDFGFDLRLRRWQWENKGLIFAGGLHQWSFDGVPDYVASNVNGVRRIRGGMGFLHFGAGMFIAPIKNDAVEVSFDAGLRMHLGLTQAKAQSVPIGTNVVENDIKTADSLMAWVGAQASYTPETWPSFVLGVGYQQTVIGGDLAISGNKVSDLDLNAFFVRLGIMSTF